MGDEQLDDFKDYFDEYWREQEELEDTAKLRNSIPNNIILKSGDSEMLRIAEDGFYVRGVRVEADTDESRKVYAAFKQWLTWALINGEGK
jgi:hypothetical protein